MMNHSKSSIGGESPPLFITNEQRTIMIGRVVEILRETNTNSLNLEETEETTAIKFEETLYRNATSLENYLNQTTLKPRVEGLLQLEVINRLTTNNTYEELEVRPLKRQRVMLPRDSTHQNETEILCLSGSTAESSSCSVNEWGGFLVPPKLVSSEVGETQAKYDPIITREQLRQHLSSLCSSVDQFSEQEFIELSGFDEEQIEKDVSNCSLCGLNELSFCPKPRLCSSCNKLIKPNMVFYYSREEDSSEICFCTSCFTNSRGGFLFTPKKNVSKSKLNKKKNDEAPIEHFVECYKCKTMQHEICGLYNRKSNPDRNLPYTCPKCILEEMESELYVPSPTSAFFLAKDLKQTVLSNHIESRLFTSLKREREQRAEQLGKPIHEVPGAENLFVRVVLSVKKKFGVSQRFLDALPDDVCPSDFPYVEKSILLFQKIDGIDVCLFNMYVQEYGSDCYGPNNRSAYISYFDSVNYLRPNVKTVHGESLRTFVYHQILIAYLDYLKIRGFFTCSLWSCPPVKGDNYILYCHPEEQKTPKADMLRRWYQSMIKKATSEGIVVNSTTMYERYFTPNRPNYDMSAARVPYFSGDFYPWLVDYHLTAIEKERKEDAKNAMKRCVTKTSKKAIEQSIPAEDEVTTEELLTQKLRQNIANFKENSIIMDLQFTCSICIEPILYGKCWSYNNRRNSHLCESCHAFELTSLGKSKNLLVSKVSVDVPSYITDEDETIENDIGLNRHDFLSFCKMNNYQFDTLRRAKHSSMMILYHLRHLAQPTDDKLRCHICHEEDNMVEKCWSCNTCPGFHICEPCYQQKDGSLHIHKLSPRAHRVTLRESQKVHMLNILEHANHCQDSTEDMPCAYYPICNKIKVMFIHAGNCDIRAERGCNTCLKVWYALRIHSRQCNKQYCPMPYCGVLSLQEALK